jgi:RNA polymerase sigma-70 factor (family 1)
MRNPIYNTLTDKELLKYIAQNDHLAFEQLFNRYWTSLFDTAYNVLKSKDLAEDIVQEVFVNIWQRRSSLKVEKEFAGYIHQSAKYATFQYLKREVKKVAYSEDFTQQTQGQNKLFSNPIEDLINIKELEKIIQNVVEELPRKCQQVFRLKREEGLSITKIAEITGIAPKTVQNHINRANTILRSKLSEYLFMFLIIMW